MRISDSDYQKIIDFVINPVETRQASLEKPETLRDDYPVPEDVKTMEGFIEKSAEELKTLMDKMALPCLLMI